MPRPHPDGGWASESNLREALSSEQLQQDEFQVPGLGFARGLVKRESWPRVLGTEICRWSVDRTLSIGKIA